MSDFFYTRNGVVPKLTEDISLKRARTEDGTIKTTPEALGKVDDTAWDGVDPEATVISLLKEIYNKVGSSEGAGALHYICTKPSAIMTITDNAWHRLSLNPGHGILQQDTTPGDYGLTLKNEYYSNCTWKITFGASYYQQSSVLFVSLRLSNEDGSVVTAPAGGNQVWADSSSANQYSTVFNQTFAIRPDINNFPAGSRIYLEICHPAVGSAPSAALRLTDLTTPYIYDFEVIPD